MIKISDSRLSSRRPVLIKYQVIIDESIENRIKEVKDIMLSATLLKIEVTPNTRVKLVMQLPIILPKPTSNKRFLKAWIVVISSGNEVPSEMIVAPITDGGTPSKPAIPTLLSTSSLDEKITNDMAIKNLTITTNLSLLYMTVISSTLETLVGVLTLKNINKETSIKPRSRLTWPVCRMNKGIKDEIKRNSIRLS